MHYASMVGSVEIVKFLISRNANVNAVNSVGQTPLYCIIRFGTNKKIETIKELITSGANVNATSNCNETILDYALRHDADEEIIALLKMHGARSRT